MQKEFRYRGVTFNNKPVQGVVLAHNKSKAKQLIKQIATKHRIKINVILPKKTFLYTVKLKKGKKIKGKQTAFTKEEVSKALAKIGYRDAKIEPALLDFHPKPPFQSILMFVNLSSFLLKEKMTYDKILRMLAEEETNPTLKETLKKIESQLKSGKEGTEVFARFKDVFGKFPAYMLGLATKSGNMAEVYDATSKFMERDLEYKKSLKKAILTPMIMIIATILAVGYYVVSIFPATARIFVEMGVKIPPMTAFTLKISDYFGANWWWMFLMIAVPAFLVVMWWRTAKGRVWRDRFLIKLPVIGHLLHKSSIEIFFRVFSAIYSGAEANIEALTASAEACRNTYMEKGVKEIAIPLMLKEGMALVPALAESDVFTTTALNRLKTGAETGNILVSAQQIAAFYEKETVYKMENIIQSIQTFIGLFIGIVVTALTIVSAEIAMVSPEPGI
ncbi:MAG: type II secretion system F family protein [Candidatus Cloacimonetes bacterium]|nr:type II secretion system F family protein [Candidatus Cloacimonadota bacterium]